MNAKPKTELNRSVFVQKRNSVNGASFIPTSKEIAYCSKLSLGAYKYLRM